LDPALIIGEGFMKAILILLGILMIATIPAAAEEPPRFQIFGGYSYMHTPQKFTINPIYVDLYSMLGSSDGGTHQNGWNVSLAANLTKNLALVADTSGHYSDRNVRADSGTSTSNTVIREAVKSSTHSFLFGPRYTFWSDRKINPFGHALFGFSKENRDIAIRVTSQSGGVSATFLDSDSLSDTSFAFAVGGGIDWRCSKHFSIRLLQADYVRAKKEFEYKPLFYANGSQWRMARDSMANNLRLSTGIVFNIGKM
jgi:opacity protein-like surface antigen